MTVYHKYYEDIMCEVDVVYSMEHQEDVPLSLSIYMLNALGEVLWDRNITTVLDWNTPNHLINLAYEVLERGKEQ